MEQQQSWIIRETFDGVKYHDVQTCASLDDVAAWVGNQQSRESREIMVVERIVAETVLGTQTIPAYIPTLEEIANEIIGGSDGSFYIEWGDDFQKLDEPDRSKVEDMVNEEIASCDCCGWHWHVESMENFVGTGDNLCYKCAEDRREEEEEEEDEDNEY